MESEHTMIVGEGATLFAQEKGLVDADKISGREFPVSFIHFILRDGVG